MRGCVRQRGELCSISLPRRSADLSRSNRYDIEASRLARTRRTSISILLFWFDSKSKRPSRVLSRLGHNHLRPHLWCSAPIRMIRNSSAMVWIT